MYTQLSIQNIGSIKAKAYLDLESTPVIISFESSDSTDAHGVMAHSEIVLHVENQQLAAALVEAINGAVSAQSTAELVAA